MQEVIRVCNVYLHIHFIGGSWEITANKSSSPNIPLSSGGGKHGPNPGSCGTFQQ